MGAYLPTRFQLACTARASPLFRILLEAPCYTFLEDAAPLVGVTTGKNERANRVLTGIKQAAGTGHAISTGALRTTAGIRNWKEDYLRAGGPGSPSTRPSNTAEVDGKYAPPHIPPYQDCLCTRILIYMRTCVFSSFFNMLYVLLGSPSHAGRNRLARLCCSSRLTQVYILGVRFRNTASLQLQN